MVAVEAGYDAQEDLVHSQDASDGLFCILNHCRHVDSQAYYHLLLFLAVVYHMTLTLIVLLRTSQNDPQLFSCPLHRNQS